MVAAVPDKRKSTRISSPHGAVPGGPEGPGPRRRHAGSDRRHPRSRPGGGGADVWLYGRHPVLAAVANPQRRLVRLVVLAPQAPDLAAALAGVRVPRPVAETVDRREIEHLLPPGAVHQGFAASVLPLPDRSLHDIVSEAAADSAACVVVLDQAADPRNVGSVLRSAAAFGARALIVQDRHAAPTTAVLAKAASGALETVPIVHVVNIARALRTLQAAGFTGLGLDADADTDLALAAPGGRVALVLGSEGRGLRRLVRDGCDRLARIPMVPTVDSLNVAVAAAIALYEIRRGQSAAS
jgi:23S rRNA (guanosine2251-2'-O)-methyltransferase